MFGAFLTGILGTLLSVAGGIALILSVIGFVAGGTTAPIALGIGLALLFLGGYMKYQSRQTVRTRP